MWRNQDKGLLPVLPPELWAKVLKNKAYKPYDEYMRKVLRTGLCGKPMKSDNRWQRVAYTQQCLGHLSKELGYERVIRFEADPAQLTRRPRDRTAEFYQRCKAIIGYPARICQYQLKFVGDIVIHLQSNLREHDLNDEGFHQLAPSGEQHIEATRLFTENVHDYLRTLMDVRITVHAYILQKIALMGPQHPERQRFINASIQNKNRIIDKLAVIYRLSPGLQGPLHTRVSKPECSFPNWPGPIKLREIILN